MKVKELIEALQQEDQESVVVIIRNRDRHRTLRQLREIDGMVCDDITLLGGEREYTPKVVLGINA